MVYDFTAYDVFEMAEQLERNGAKFYRTSAEGAYQNSQQGACFF
jgi:hypothetical protein